MEKNKIVVGITQGDINGIGYELILKSLADSRVYDNFTPVIYGSSKIAAYYRKLFDLSININVVNSASEAIPKRINILNCIDEEIRVELGKSSQEAGIAAYKALEIAVDDLKNGTINALVTAPVNKQNIQQSVSDFSGHANYLEKAFEYKENSSLLMFVNDFSRIAVVTGNIPFKDILPKLTKELILEKIQLLNETLKNDFTVIKPRIAVLGLNPDILQNKDSEEKNIIIPAIKSAEEQGIVCTGPYFADDFFASGDFSKFDAVLAMYYDQAAIISKTLSMENGIKITAGLSFIHSSPVNGVSYDHAGKNTVSEDSFRKALYASIDIYHNRKSNEALQKSMLIVEKEISEDNRKSE